MPFQELRAPIERARAIRQAREYYNCRMPSRLIRTECALDPAGERTLEMAGPQTVAGRHVADAVQYRSLDRNYWN